jgi:hypothetical protein
MASKKQLTELENVVVILEEKIEKLEEEHQMMKQMLSMQNSLIENLQMMVKMMSCNHGTSQSSQLTLIPLSGGGNPTSDPIYDVNNNGHDGTHVEQNGGEKQNKNSRIHDIRHRMSRVL